MEDRLEVHLTIDLNGRPPTRLIELARELGFKFLHIMLENGLHASQPMLTWRSQGDLVSTLNRADEVAGLVRQIGFVSTRTKIEADFSARETIATKYFEAHFKVELRSDDLDELAQFSQTHGAHLSRNAFSRDGDHELRFLTVRDFSRPVARQKFESVRSALLQSQGWRVRSSHFESVLHDSNLSLDEGWSR